MSVLIFAMGLAAAVVPDDARETRWAEEIVPQLVVGEAVWLATPQRARVLALYTEPAGKANGAVIVVHGAGVHPDWALNGDLRSALADRGYATLSVQMPVLAADAPRGDYDAVFPVAAQRLDAAVAWLQARGLAHIAVVSHSLGAAMVSAWLASTPPRGVEAWVPIGMLVAFASPPRMPVLDITAERDFPEAIATRAKRAPYLPHDKCSTPVRLGDTDHFLDHAVPRAVDAIAPFLDRVVAGNC